MPILVDNALVGQAATAPAVTIPVQDRLSDVAEARQGRKGMAVKKSAVPTRLQPLHQVNQWKS